MSSGLIGEVVEPFRVVATGRVNEGPSQLLGEESWVVFVLDPFPGLAGVRLAHACEVVCRSEELPSSEFSGAIGWR